jgi:hypothetical protein
LESDCRPGWAGCVGAVCSGVDGVGAWFAVSDMEILVGSNPQFYRASGVPHTR